MSQITHWKELCQPLLDSKLSTGAEVTAISEETYLQLGGVRLQRPTKVLCGPARHALDVLGQFMTVLKHEQDTSLLPVFVIRGLKNNLLGLPAVVALQLICRASSVRTGDNIREQFLKVFASLGTLGEPYQIKLKEGAVPHSIYTPRNVPIPLRDKVKVELCIASDNCAKISSTLGIGCASRNTLWFSGFKSTHIRTSPDHFGTTTIPAHHGVGSQISDITPIASIRPYSASSMLIAGFGTFRWPRNPAPHYLHNAIRCFNKLPFGISSAPELFQWRMNQILEGLEGVLHQMDDVLIFGATKPNMMPGWLQFWKD